MKTLRTLALPLGAGLLAIAASCSDGSRTGTEPRPATGTAHATSNGTAPRPRSSRAATVPKMSAEASRITPRPGGFRLSSASRGLHADMTAQGVAVAPARGTPGLASKEDPPAWTFDAAPARWGCDGDLSQLLPTVEPTAHDNRVDYRRAEFDEWYVSAPVGLEQGFTLAAPPPCRDRGGEGVVIELRGGSLTPVISSGGKGAVLADGSGQVQLACDRLSVVDAEGRELDAELTAGPRGLALRFDDRGARYPVTVDPVWYEQATLLSPHASGSEFGYAVAIDGATALVCEYRTNYGHGLKAGTALVYGRNAGGAWNEQQELSTFVGDVYGTCAGVALSSDTAVVAGYSGPLVFARTGGSWALQQELAGYGWADTGSTGGSLSIDGDTIVSLANAHVLGNSGRNPAVFVRSSNPQCAALSECCLSPQFTAHPSYETDFRDCQNRVTDAESAHDCEGDLANYVKKGFCAGGGDAGAGLTWSREALSEVGDLEREHAVSAALSGNRIILGLSEYGPDAGTTDGGQRYGSAVIYERSVVYQRMGGGRTTRWVKTQTLTQAAAGFGASVAISGDTAIVGAPYADPALGIAFVYVHSGRTWSLQGTLTAPDAMVPSQTPGSIGADLGGVGAIVSIGGDLAVVGPRFPLGIPGQPHVHGVTNYVFARDPVQKSWSLLDENSNALGPDQPWVSMATDGTSVIVGAVAEIPETPGAIPAQLPGAGGTAFIYSTLLPAHLGLPDGGADGGDAGCPRVIVNGAVTNICNDPDETVTVTTGCSAAPVRLRPPALPLVAAIGAYLGIALRRRRARRSAVAAAAAGMVAGAVACEGSTTVTITDPDEDATVTIHIDGGSPRRDSGGGIPDTSTGTEGGPTDALVDAVPQKLTVTPPNPKVLTCSTAVFTGTVTPQIGTETFTWSATAGSIKNISDPDAGPGAHALFTAPTSMDAGPVTISATATVTPPPPVIKASGSTMATLADFDPQPGQTDLAPPSPTAYYPIDYPHAMASLGNVVYAPFPVVLPDGQTILAVWKSVDSGKSWAQTKGSTPVGGVLRAGAVPELGIGAVVQYWSTAVDAVDPNTVYIAFQNSGTAGVVGDSGATGTTLFFMVSTNGGDTFTSGPLLQYTSGPWYGAGVYFPDVISPARGSVVLMTSDDYWGQFWFWSDTKSGAGLTGGPLPFACPLADWCPPGDGGVTNCLGAACLYEPYPSGNIGVVGGFQQPKFFTDGAGALCMAYLETPDNIVTSEPVVQCSPDLGRTWAPLIHFTTPSAVTAAAFPSGTARAVGGGKDVIVLTWSDSGVLHIATVTTNPTSPDPAATVRSGSTADGTLRPPSAGSPSFGGGSATSDVRFDGDGVLWLVYSVEGTSSPEPQTAIDKSCDNGVSWKGGTYVGGVADLAGWQGLVPLTTENGYSSGMGISAQWGGSPTADGGEVTIGQIFYRVSP